MNIYHFNVFPPLIERIEQEFGPAGNLILGENEEKPPTWWSSWGYGPDWLFGIKPGMKLENLLVVNRSGFLHHFTYYLVQALMGKYNNFAYLHIDQHTDASQIHYAHAIFAYQIHAGLGIPVYLLIKGNKDLERRGVSSSDGLSMVRLLKDGECKDFPSDTIFEFTGERSLNQRVLAAIVRSIKEQEVYHSLDVDVFPWEDICNDWPLSRPGEDMNHNIQKETDFSIETYQEILEKLLRGKHLIGADVTGACFPEPLDVEKTVQKMDNWQNLPDAEWQQLVETRRGEYQKQKLGAIERNNHYMENVLEIIRFLCPYLNKVRYHSLQGGQALSQERA